MEGSLFGVEAGSRGGNKRRTRMSFKWGTAEVATARSVGSVGQIATLEGENAIQALE